MMIRIKAVILLAVFFLLSAAFLFSQDELLQRGSIPEELLRPQRGESPRYPIDTVIGELGQGKAPKEAYDCARRAAAAFLAGTKNAPVFSSAEKVFIESCINVLSSINPRYFRLGSGREEPDGSVSFLIRFAGREEGITGELYIRQEQKRIELAQSPPPAAAPPTAAPLAAAQNNAAQNEAAQNGSDSTLEGGAGAAIADAETAAVPPVPVQVDIVWVFEDIIMDEPRSREVENKEDSQRFDFPPYERIF